ncbi:MAG: NACHT domain-containing protein, partial [Lachnospiraceae bacterium]
NSEKLYEIEPLNDSTIREYCKNCLSIIYKKDKQDAWVSVAEEILRRAKTSPEIKQMASVPLTLAQLITFCRYGDPLPENKAKLYQNLMEIYLGWVAEKGSILSCDAMYGLLSYIACYLTKHRKMSCSYEELFHVIEDCCFKDLTAKYVGILPENIPTIVSDLERSGIFTKVWNNDYGFASHRTMQEYLTAYAIENQCADTEYNQMLPREIFSRNFGLRGWNEVIVYALFMKGSQSRIVLEELIKKTMEHPERTVYKERLFDLYEAGVPMGNHMKYQIWDLSCQDTISSLLYWKFSRMRENPEFSDYIRVKFKESIQNSKGPCSFGYARAVLEAGELEERSLFQHIDTRVEVESYLFEEDECKIVLGLEIIRLFAWFKYNNEDDRNYYWKMEWLITEKEIAGFRELLQKGIRTEDVALCLKNCFLAECFSFTDVIDDATMNVLMKDLEKQKKYSEIILSFAPVQDLPYHLQEEVDFPFLRKEYEERFEQEVLLADKEHLIFTYTILSLIYKFEFGINDVISHFSNRWDRVKSCYEKDDADRDRDDRSGYSVGKLRYRQVMCDGFHTKKFMLDGIIHTVAYRGEKLSTDARELLLTNETDLEDAEVRGRLATYYRKNEIEGVFRQDTILQDFRKVRDEVEKSLSYDNLIYLMDINAFCLILNALDEIKQGVITMDDFCNEQSGHSESAILPLSKGIRLLEDRMFPCYPIGDDWIRASRYWIKKAIDEHDVEGVVVAYLLFEVQMLSLGGLTYNEIEKFCSFCSEICTTERYRSFLDYLKKEKTYRSFRSIF